MQSKSEDIVMYKNQELLSCKYLRQILERIYFRYTYMNNICIYIYTYKKNDQVNISGHRMQTSLASLVKYLLKILQKYVRDIKIRMHGVKSDYCIK